jgi:signal peptidase I
MLSVVVWPGLGQALLGRLGWAIAWCAIPVVAMALLPALGIAAAAVVVLSRLVAGAQLATMQATGAQPDGARVALVLALLSLGTCTAVGSVRRDVVESLGLPTASMWPGYEAGDMVVVNKAAYGLRVPFSTSRVGKSEPKVGDVVAYTDAKGKLAMARVIALGPTTFAIKAGAPVIGGQALVQRPAAGECGYATMTEKGKWADRKCRLVEEQAGARRYPVALPPADASATVVDVAEQAVPDGHVVVIDDNRDLLAWAIVPRGSIVGRPAWIWFSTAGERGVRWGRMGKHVVDAR